MYEYRCRTCGKLVLVEYASQVRKFCSKECYGTFNRQKREKEYEKQGFFDRPAHLPICAQGYYNLVAAVSQQAADDVLNKDPENRERQDTENFLLSDWFNLLTGLDGFEVLYRLTCICEEQQRKKKGRKPNEQR